MVPIHISRDNRSLSPAFSRAAWKWYNPRRMSSRVYISPCRQSPGHFLPREINVVGARCLWLQLGQSPFASSIFDNIFLPFPCLSLRRLVIYGSGNTTEDLNTTAVSLNTESCGSAISSIHKLWFPRLSRSYSAVLQEAEPEKKGYRVLKIRGKWGWHPKTFKKSDHRGNDAKGNVPNIGMSHGTEIC